MLPDNDPRHGTNAGYNAACRNQCCKTAHANYRRNLRTRAYFARGPLTVNSLGTRRRIHALVALGHSMEAMDAAMGRSRGYTFRASRHDFTHRTTADMIANLYEAWSMVVPAGRMAQRNRNLAARRGWAPPLAWDDIDDPTEQPNLAAQRTEKTDVDPVVVQRLIAGDRIQHNITERKLAVAHLWHHGLGPVAIGQKLGMSSRTIDKDVERLGLRRKVAA